MGLFKINLYSLVSMEERLRLEDGMKVLDVGCGHGELLSGLRCKNILRVGLDVARQKLLKAHRKNNTHFILGDACNLPFKTKVFDSVSSRQFVSHVWDLDKALAEMLRVSKNTFYLEDSNLLNQVVFFQLLFRFGPSWLLTKSKVYNISTPSDCGKKEDIHSVFWWKRKMQKSIIVLTRKHWHNPLLDSLWKYFGPDCIFSIQQEGGQT